MRVVGVLTVVMVVSAITSPCAAAVLLTEDFTGSGSEWVELTNGWMKIAGDGAVQVNGSVNEGRVVGFASYNKALPGGTRILAAGEGNRSRVGVLMFWFE